MKNILLTIIPLALLLMVKPLSTHAKEISCHELQKIQISDSNRE